MAVVEVAIFGNCGSWDAVFGKKERERGFHNSNMAFNLISQ